MPVKPYKNNTHISTVNTPENNIVTGKEATQYLLQGIKTATGAIRLSYGAKGVNAIIEDEFYPYHMIANDCETILQSIQVTGKFEKIGLDILKELSTKAHKDSGDGRKTTCIIGEEIIERGFKSDVLGVELKRELDSLIPIIESKIDEQKKTITEEEVHKVATIAGESEELGNTLGEIYKKIGKDGIIIPEGSGTYTTYYEYIEGVRFMDTGYLSPYMVHDDDARKEGRKETRCVYENPTILVTKRKITHIDDINPLLAMLVKEKKKDLIIFTDDMDSGVASLLVKAHRDNILNILVIKAPVLWKNYVFEDFAKVTGATIVEDASGVNYKNLELGHLGTCGKITVDKEETTIVGGADISDHISDLKSRRDDNDSLLRLSWLTTKTCILRLGANNESELSYKRLKCYDAINASKLALRDGIVPGGGVALLNASRGLPDTEAGQIVREALKEPVKQILKNSGYTAIDINEWAKSGIGKYIFIEGDDFRSGRGMDVIKGGIVDMFEAGIVDAAAVVKNAVRNAISLASTILTGKILVRTPDKTSEQIAAEVLQQKGIRF